MKKITLLLMFFTSFLSFSQLTEGFEGTSQPAGGTWALGSGSWAVFDNGVGLANSWTSNNSVTTPPNVYAGARAAYMNGAQDNVVAGSTAEDWLVSPAVTVPANGQVRFFTRQSLSSENGTLFQVRVSTTSQTDASSFTLLQQWDESTLTTLFSSYEEKVISLNLPAGTTAYVALVMVKNGPGTADRWFVDEFKIVEECVAPTTLGTGTVTPTTANLTWANPGGVTSWEIEIIPETGTPTGHGVVYNGSSPYAATGTATGSPLVQAPFAAGTEYKFYVRALCAGPGTQSAWVGPYEFTIGEIGETCSSAIIIPGLPYSTTDDTANYGDTIEGVPGTSCGVQNGYLNGNDVFYSYTATETGVISISMTPSNTYSGIFVYNGCANVGVSCIAGVGDFSTDIREIPALAVTAGQTYIILISTWASPQTTPYTLLIQKVNCTPPNNLGATNITTTDAELSWGNPGDLAASWQIDVQLATAPIPSGTGITTTNNTAYPQGSLLPSTPYRFYVRADCGDGTFSAWAGPYLFNTQCTSFNVPFFEGFNSDSQTQFCWTVLNVNGDTDTWNMDYDVNPFEGNEAAAIVTDFNNGNNDDYLVSPTLNLNGNQRLKYHYRVNSTFEPDAFEVLVSTTGISPANFTQTIVPLATYSNTTYVEKIVNLTGITGPVNIAWRVPPGGPDGWVLYIDNVIVEDIPTCPNPSDLTASNFNMTSAQLSWTPGNVETQWQVVVQAPGAGVPTATAGGTPVGNPYVANTTAAGVALTPGTQYEYYVRAYCASNDVSQWVGPFLFNTALCNVVDQCTYNFIMTDSFGDGWNGNTMSILQNGVTVATIGSTFTTGAGPITVQVPLCDGVPFELYWNSGGSFAGEVGIQVVDAYEEDVYIKLPGEGSQDSLLFTGTVDCTPPPCPRPQALTVVSTGLDNAVLDWNEMGGATSWEIVYQPQGGTTPTGTSLIVTTPPPYTLEGLTSGTAYSFFVRALCNATDISNWAGPVNFATAIANDECADATVVPINPDLQCTQTVPGILIGATGSVEDNTCFGNADDDVWFEFVATSTAHLISLNNVVGSTTDLYHVVYEGDQCGALTQLYCSDPNTSTASGLTIGNTYKIRVYSWSDQPQTTAFDVCIRTPQPPIATDNTTYSVEQLVSEILIGSTCAQVSNITFSTGTDFGQENGIAYFTQNGSSFPFASGIALTSGDAMRAPGPNDVLLGDGDMNTWPGDLDLENAINDPDGDITHNATIIEFDFVPLTDQLSFNFIFASEEYTGSFQCTYDDAFAFLLTDSNGVTQNLAVLPNGDLVAVTNIHPENFSCPAINEEYFDQYNDDVSGAINFNGQTVPLTAAATVVPNTQYHIKLVIADQRDASYDSAIFLEAGSFNIGAVDLGVDLTVAGGNAVCGGESYTILSGLDPDDYDFTWTQDGAVIPGETGPNLTVSETGDYGINAVFTGSTCAAEAVIRVEFYDEIEVITGEPNDLVACDPDGFATFDLSQNTPLILAGLTASDYTVSYHLSQSDVDANVGALPLSYENVVQYLQPIFVRIINNTTQCVGSKTFDLIVQDLTPQFTITPDFSLCDGTSGTITVTPSNFNAADVTFTWTLNGSTTLPDTGNTITVSAAGFYEVTINNNGCSATDGTTVTITPVPVADVLQGQTVCDSYTLPALSAGNNYYTAQNGGGTQLAVGAVISQTQEIFVYAQSGTTPNCTDQSSFLITVIPQVDAIVDGTCNGSEYTMEVLPVNSSFDESTATYSWALETAPNVVLGTQQSLVVTEAGNYVVTVTVGGTAGCSYDFNFTANGTTCNIQKGISPNGDGKNDSFDLSGLQVRKISIFNRYGTLVYDKTNYSDEWYGQSNKGDALPDGTYYYSFEREGGESKTGWIYVNRER